MRVGVVTLLLGELLVCTSCARTDAQKPLRLPVRFASVADGSFIERLVNVYGRSIPDVHVQRVVIPGSTNPLVAVQQGQADLALTTSDNVYSAYKRDVDAASHANGALRAIATVQTLALQVVLRHSAEVRLLSDLRTQALGIASGSPLHRLVLEALRIRVPTRLVYRGVPDVRTWEALADGRIDGLFISLYYPAAPVTAALSRGARILPVEGEPIDRLLRDNAFLRAISIPAGTYPGQSQPIHTIGTDVVLVCRREMEEGTVHELARGLFEALPELSASFMNLTDADGAPVTPIPLHPGAARYYRELELFQ